MRPFNKILISLLILALFINHAKSARAETVINNCTVLGAAGETYSLANDIFNSNNMSCMRANADNVTLDCGGHVIDSMYINGASGVYAESVKNFTVRNCSLAEWWYGIQFASTTASIVENVNSSYNYWGVYLFGGGANNITRSLFSWNSRDGIWAASASANVIENSTIRQNSYNGIYLSSSSLNNMTGLSVYSNGLSGINISSSSNNTVSLSSIYSNAKNGIFIGASSEGNKAENTTLRLNSVSGVYLQSGSSRSVFRNVNSSINVLDGFYLFSSSNNSFYNVTAGGNQRDGLYLESSSNQNNVSACKINENEIYGIMIQLSSGNNFTGCNVGFNKNQGVRVYDADGNTFTGCIVGNSTNYDVYAASSGSTNNYLINTTFDGSKASINTNAVIWVRWYLQMQVIDLNSSVPVENANVSARDAFGSLAFSVLTDSGGHTEARSVTEYNQTVSGRNYYNNYTINVTASTFRDGQTSENVTSSRVVTIYIESNESLHVAVKTYNPELDEEDIFKPGGIVRIRALVSLDMGREYLRNSTVTIKNNSSAIIVDGLPMTNISDITNGYIYEYNYTIPGNGEGIWTIDIVSTDSFARKGYGSKRIAVSPLTIQIKMVLNSTSDSIYIPGSGETPFPSLASREYASPPHYYIASSTGESLKAVVFSQLRPFSLFTEKDTGTYSMGIKQRYSNSVVFIVFSKGKWTAINNRMGLIEKGGFLSSPSPSFGFGLGSSYPLKVVLAYGNIGINNTADIGRGYNRLVIENVGEAGGKPDLKIGR